MIHAKSINIIPTDPKTWCESRNESLKNYSLHGVHDSGTVTRLEKIIENFIVKVPSHSRVICNYTVQIHHQHNHFNYVAYGTALIPKKE